MIKRCSPNHAHSTCDYNTGQRSEIVRQSASTNSCALNFSDITNSGWLPIQPRVIAHHIEHLRVFWESGEMVGQLGDEGQIAPAGQVVGVIVEAENVYALARLTGNLRAPRRLADVGAPTQNLRLRVAALRFIVS